MVNKFFPPKKITSLGFFVVGHCFSRKFTEQKYHGDFHPIILGAPSSASWRPKTNPFQAGSDGWILWQLEGHQQVPIWSEE